LTRPFEHLKPENLRDPVADPIIRSGIDEHSDTALKETSDVILGWSGGPVFTA
jgi:hypothetical protein